MSWTTASELRAQLARLWARGQLPQLLVTGDSDGGWPLRLLLKGPSSTDITERFDAVREWSAALAAVPHIRLEWRPVQHRVQGLQRLPTQVWVDSMDDALTLLGKRRDAQLLLKLVDRTRSNLPMLMPWLAKRPLQALELAEQWPRLLAVVAWLMEHPRPGIYLRQVDIAGVHSKFIEAHRAVLAELLDLALPASAIATDRAGTSQFAHRYGFLDKPARIRFRMLDERMAILPGCTTQADITLDAHSFASLVMPVTRVFITENETNFLAFPKAANAIVVFGAGYGWDALANALWLADCSVHYWGDIDTHGFAILDQLRRRFAHVSSFLMDRETLGSHEAHWGEEPIQAQHDLPHLTETESILYNELRDNRIRQRLRLEQEHVGFKWVIEALSRLQL
jgi:hypothetical protein